VGSESTYTVSGSSSLAGGARSPLSCLTRSDVYILANTHHGASATAYQDPRYARLAQSRTGNSVAGQERIAAMTAAMMQSGADAQFASLRALRVLAGEMQRQALVMSYVDGFWIMGVGLLVAAPLVFLLRRPAPGAMGAMH